MTNKDDIRHSLLEVYVWNAFSNTGDALKGVLENTKPEEVEITEKLYKEMLENKTFEAFEFAFWDLLDKFKVEKK